MEELSTLQQDIKKLSSLRRSMVELSSLLGTVVLDGMPDFDRSISTVEKQLKTFQRKMGKLGATAGTAFTGNLTTAINKAIGSLKPNGAPLGLAEWTDNDKLKAEIERGSQDAFKRIADNERLFLNTRLQALRSHKDARMAVLIAAHEKERKDNEGKDAELLAIDLHYANESMKILEETTRRKWDIIQRTITTWADTITTSVNRLNTSLNKYYADRITMSKRARRDETAELVEAHNERKKYLEENNLDVEDENTRHREALAELKEKHDASELKLMQKQIKREKAFGIYSATIDTIRAVMKAYADFGLIVGSAMAAAITGVGVAQIAIIRGTPEPELGPPLYVGGLIKGTRDGILAQIGERNQSEVVLPLERGTEQIANKLMAALQSQSSPTIEHHSHYHIGTLVADENGLRALERKLRPHRIAEDRRTGV
jgi:hypothetical protein